MSDNECQTCGGHIRSSTLSVRIEPKREIMPITGYESFEPPVTVEVGLVK